MAIFNYSQANRPLKVSTPLGPDVVLIRGFRGREAVSELFSFELDLMALRHLPIPFEKLLGQSATVQLTLPNGVARHFNGIICRFGEAGREHEFTRYRATMVPRVWLWQKRFQSRIYQQMTVPEILGEALDGLDVKWDLSRDQYEPRDYCVQYRESDFDFVSRLMEEEGVFYYFEHAADNHTMVVSDHSPQQPDVLPWVIRYDDVEHGLRGEVRIHRWEKLQQVGFSKITLRDHCFELPGQNLEASESIQETVQVGAVEHKLPLADRELECYQYPGEYAQRFDGVNPGGGDRSDDLTKIYHDNERTARLRAEREAVACLDVSGESDCLQFLPGYQFQLTRHAGADGKYVLTSVEHEARSNAPFRSVDKPSQEKGAEDELTYTNRFTCIPDELPYRPERRTPKPTIAGVQTATVVGPEEEQIFVDKYGRVKVQFHWDRQGKHDADSSCWVRVGQAWAGPRWGAFFWPRIGHEVIVAFAEGDPDQPVIVGTVYNAANMPPVELPKFKDVCGFKSCTVGGDPTTEFNCVMFHDTPGDEHVHIHSETHEVITSEVAKYRRTPGPTVEVSGNLPFGS